MNYISRISRKLKKISYTVSVGYLFTFQTLKLKRTKIPTTCTTRGLSIWITKLKIERVTLLLCIYLHFSDSDYQRPVPNLDGGEGAAEHLIFGTNVDLQEVDGASAEGGVVEEGQGSKSHL